MSFKSVAPGRLVALQYAQRHHEISACVGSMCYLKSRENIIFEGIERLQWILEESERNGSEYSQNAVHKILK